MFFSHTENLVSAINFLTLASSWAEKEIYGLCKSFYVFCCSVRYLFLFFVLYCIFINKPPVFPTLINKGLKFTSFFVHFIKEYFRVSKISIGIESLVFGPIVGHHVCNALP